MIIDQKILNLFKDEFNGWRSISKIDMGVINSIHKVTSDDIFSDDVKRQEFYNKLNNLSLGDRTTYRLQIRKLTGSAQLISNVPFMFQSFGSYGLISGSIPTKGQTVLIFYVGDEKWPIAVGGRGTDFFKKIASGIIPVLKSGEHIIQSEIRNDMSSDTIHRPGARAYFDFKGRLILSSTQKDGDVDGKVTITLGNPVHETDDETKQFASKDEETGKEIVFSIETVSGVTINVDTDGNVHSKILKDYIKQCVNEQITLTGNKTVSIEGNEEITVSGHHHLVCDDIKIGDDNATEPVVLGNILKTKLKELVDIIIRSRHIHPYGPTTGLFPGDITKLNSFKSKLSEIDSKVAKTK